MSAGDKLISYGEIRALEDAAYGRQVTPTRICAILLPLWCAEVEADITEGEPYDLIDGYLERGIAQAGLTSAAELAGFFALDAVLVDRALRFLTAIGHVAARDGHLALTGLGARSVRDKVRYVATRKDRRKLYFDAFASRPLTRRYYDTGAVTLVPAAGLGEATAAAGGTRFQVMESRLALRTEAVAELARDPHRDRYNLPERIDVPRVVGTPERVYLPAYVVRAVGPGGRVTLLAYTQATTVAAPVPDPEISALCGQVPELAAVIETEEADGSRTDERRITRMLAKWDFDRLRPERVHAGLWRVTFPRSAFAADGPLKATRIGSFVRLGTGFFQVWCAEEQTRRAALLERADNYLAARTRTDRAETETVLARIARQMELPVDLSGLRRLAAASGRTALATQLDHLT